MDISAQLARAVEVVTAEGGIGRPGWGAPQPYNVDNDAQVRIYFWRQHEGGGSDVVRIVMDKGDLYRLPGPLLDRFIKAHLEIVRVYAEAMDQ
jgi:hypothetical protein